jgi:ribonuclease E
MAGLVVIDFIDMEYGSNIRKVEKAMKEALKNDRARLQIGRISSFGLMEMSRQRLRTGVLEATTRMCPHCDGTGLVRTASSAGLSALRLIEDEAAKGRGSIITLYASTEASVYLLNAKRADLAEIDNRYGVRVEVIPEGENEGAKMRVASSGPRPEFVPRFEPIVDDYEDEDLPADDEEFEDEAEAEEAGSRAEGDGEGRRKRRKRRRGRGRDRREDAPVEETAEAAEAAEAAEDDEETGADDDVAAYVAEPAEEGEGPRKRRRRGRRRRGGRGRAEASQDAESETEAQAPLAEVEPQGGTELIAEAEAASIEAVQEAPPKPKRTRRKRADAETEAAPVEATEPAGEVADEAPAKPKRTRRKKADADTGSPAETSAEPAEEVTDEAPAKPKRTRRKKADAEATVAEASPQPVIEIAQPQPEPTIAVEAAVEREADTDIEGEEPRRGWWQRTFGN